MLTWHAFAVGLPHRIAIACFEVTFLGIGMRIYALYQFERLWFFPIAAFCTGTLLALASIVPTMRAPAVRARDRPHLAP